MAFIPEKRFSGSDRLYKYTFGCFKNGVRLDGDSIAEPCLTKLENMWLSHGQLCTREGQKSVALPVAGACHGSALFGGRLVLHVGTSLYTWDGTQTVLSAVAGVLADSASTMFTFGSFLYIIDGTSYKRLDTSFALSAVTPYIPVILTGSNAAGTEKTAYESLNLIGRGFSVWFDFTGNGVYKLPYGDLAPDSVTVKLNGSDISASCLVNRTEGSITVSGAAAGNDGINNLRVTAYLKEAQCSADKARITGCRVSAVYGGTGSGTRVFLAGNPSYPTHCFRSYLLDPTYFPDTEFELVGSGDDEITAMAVRYGELVVFLKRSVYAFSYVSSANDVVFAIRCVNSRVGCDMPNSVQLINGTLVFADSTGGVRIILSTDIENENNILPVSVNVNGDASSGLNSHSRAELENARSADFGSHYFLFVGTKAYIWDYGASPYVQSGDTEKAARRLSWYIFTNVKAGFPQVLGGRLCYTSYDTAAGKTGLDAYGGCERDFDVPVISKLMTNQIDMELPEKEKRIFEGFAVYGGRGNTRAVIDFFCDGKTEEYGADDSVTVKNGSFSFSNFAWDLFSFSISRFVRYFTVKLRVRLSRAVAVRITSDTGGFCLDELTLRFRA